jgi:hypothetical protein
VIAASQPAAKVNDQIQTLDTQSEQRGEMQAHGSDLDGLIGQRGGC